MTTKQLRHKILDLAIHGRLVPQDPSDEPASALLSRIRAEKEQLVADGKLKKKDLASTPVSDEDKPFDVPDGWEWCRLGEICSTIGDGLHGTPAYDSNGDYYFINGNNLNENIEIKADTKRTTEEEFQKQGLCFDSQTIFVSINGTIGNVAFYNNEKIVLGKSACYINLIKKLCRDYIAQIIKSKYFLKYATESATGSTIKNVPLAAVRSLPIPLPPLAEQQRIVAAVEQWMSLVDIIESGQENLHQSIALAKNKILDLAIKGKLVEKEGEWEEKTLASISTDSADGPFGSNLKREHYTFNKEVRIIQLSNIGEDGWRDENTKYTTFEHLPNIARSEVHPGDIVIAKMMPAGRAILCPSDDKKYVLSSDAVKFVLKDGLYDRYVLYAINSSYFREQVYDDVQGVTRVRTSLKKLREYTIPLPPLSEQHRIVSKIEELFTQLDNIAEALK